MQTLTDSAGRFALTGLRGGTHNLIAYSLDGSYLTFQQGAQVEGNKGTPVEIKMKPAQLVNVIFTVSVPPNTQKNVPLRMAGNLLQFGNTFDDLRGGLSTVARPHACDNAITRRTIFRIVVPAGWRAPRLQIHVRRWVLELGIQHRRAICGSKPCRSSTEYHYQRRGPIWQAGPNAPITFEVEVPQDTPISDSVYIQFNPFSWTEPLPMWKVSNNRWEYKLYGPLNIVGAFTYRYCRNAQYDSADDASSAGDNAHGKNVTPSITAQDILDTVNQWAWTSPKTSSLVQTTIPARGTGFVAGVEFQSYHDPAMHVFTRDALQNIQAIGGNWAILSPSWTYTSNTGILYTKAR